MDVLGLFVLVFFCSFVFNVIPGAWSPGVSTRQCVSVSSGITVSAPCVSPISHVFDVSAYCIGSAVAVLCWSFPFPSLQMQALSCPAVHHRVHYLVQGVFRAAQGFQTFRFHVPTLSHAMVCFRSSFLWSSIIASMIFAVVGFFSAKNSKVSAFMVSLMVSRLVSWSFWFATDMFMP